MSFSHLHVHTEYSPDGLANIRDLFEKAARLGMPALAITDHGTLAGVPEFLKTAEEFPTVKPIVGCEFWLGRYHLVLLAKNLTGYRNLVKLCSIGHCEGMEHSRPRIYLDQLEKYHEGLICTSACIGGEIPQKILLGQWDAAEMATHRYHQIFGDDFYLEVSLHKNLGPVKLCAVDNRESYRKQNQQLIRLQQAANEGLFEFGRLLGIKVVATNDIHFVKREDGIAHDAMMSIRHKKKVSDPNRMRFSHLEYMKSEQEMLRLFPDHPEAIANTKEIVDKVERYSIWAVPELPEVVNANEQLHKMVWKGMRLRDYIPTNLVEHELQVICDAGYAEYFLMIKDLVDWVRSNGWVVGPGRGNAPGSLVCYCLGITDVNPLEHGLLFERFWVKYDTTKVKIDLDVEPAAYEKVQVYLKEKYGKDSVSGIAVYGRYGLTSARRAATKALGKGKEAKAVAMKLLGVVMDQETIHPCGWLVARDLSSRLPLQIQEGTLEGDYTLNSLYESSWAQKVGALQINVLQLSELAMIKDAVRMIEEKDDIMIEPGKLPLDDKPTLDLFARGDTTGVFQFSSEGMREWLREVKPDRFSDLVALEALYRPNGMDKLPAFAANKHSSEGWEREQFAETYGVLVYQEQEMLLKGPFSRDTFPKSHALCYTLIAYQIAWIKAHYPEIFFEVALNHYMDGGWEHDRILQDCLNHHLIVVSPDKSGSGLFEVKSAEA